MAKTGRPRKIDASWFPFYCKDGATFSVLRQRMGPLGIGIYTEILIVLTKTPRHHVRLETEAKKQIFVSRIGLEWETFQKFLDVLILTEKINVKLWKESSVLFVPDLVDSLEGLYKDRKGEKPTSEILEAEYSKGRKSKEVPKPDPNKVLKTPPEFDLEPPPAFGIPEDEPAVVKGKTKRFKAPTKKELDEYASSIGFPELDSDSFLDHYKSNGWKVGGRSPMKDWEAAVRTWRKNDRQRKPEAVKPPSKTEAEQPKFCIKCRRRLEPDGTCSRCEENQDDT